MFAGEKNFDLSAQEKYQPMTTDWSKHISANIAKVWSTNQLIENWITIAKENSANIAKV